jgi:hypothetical protein
LTDFLARSFREAIAEPCAERGKRLALELGLSAPGKCGAPKVNVDEQEIHEFVAAEIIKDPKFSETKLKAKVAAKFGISETKAIEFVKPTAFVPKLLRSNGIQSLIKDRK